MRNQRTSLLSNFFFCLIEAIALDGIAIALAPAMQLALAIAQCLKLAGITMSAEVNP
jgi:hypothetical protein